jgi:hypothetical protein
MTFFVRSAALALTLTLAPTLGAEQAAPRRRRPTAAAKAPDKAPDALPPLPADAHVDQTMQLAGRR